MSSLSSRTFIVRISNSYGPSHSVRRVFINADVLKAAKIVAGDVVAVCAADKPESNTSDERFTAGSKSEGTEVRRAFAAGVAWPSISLSPESVLVSSCLLLTCHAVEGVAVAVFPLSGPECTKMLPVFPTLPQVRKAGLVRLRETLPNGHPAPPSNRHTVAGKGSRRDWLTLALKEMLVDLKYITDSLVVEFGYEGRTRRFNLLSASSGSDRDDVDQSLSSGVEALSIDAPRRLWTVGWDSAVCIVENDVKNAEIKTITEPPEPGVAYSSVGGLDKQIAQIRDLLEIPLTRPELFRKFGLRPPRGILLHGPPGTGKTHLARAIASSHRTSVLVVNGPELSSAYHGETESNLRDIFKAAKDKSPCIVVLDEIDALVPRREDGAGGEVEKRVVATLLTILDGMDDVDQGGFIVIGTTNRPNAIDPALRRPGRFDREIEIGIPDADARFSILQVLLSKAPHSILPEDIRTVADRAYGYVGADLSEVIREAGTLAIKRYLHLNPINSLADGPMLSTSDLLAALPSIRPSAMRTLFLDTPPIRYSDIGGQAHVIQKLRETVEWPLLHPEAFKRLGVRPPKGVLLYGPPGCSKTILVRACACESGLNFVAVKGPELLNKFLGESERAVRDVFRKARAASPSIIFFDEIDALGTSRSPADSDSTSGTHEGVLTSLLNEMDGVQELLGVTVVAATNRPDVIDPALTRPGRLDRIIYVGTPDQNGREEILRIRMRSMCVGPGVDVEEIARLTEGYSGAELTSLCQEAAFLTMRKDMNAPYVPHDAFVTAAKSTKSQITPDVVQRFERWRASSTAGK